MTPANNHGARRLLTWLAPLLVLAWQFSLPPRYPIFRPDAEPRPVPARGDTLGLG